MFDFLRDVFKKYISHVFYEAIVLKTVNNFRFFSLVYFFKIILLLLLINTEIYGWFCSWLGPGGGGGGVGSAFGADSAIIFVSVNTISQSRSLKSYERVLRYNPKQIMNIHSEKTATNLSVYWGYDGSRTIAAFVPSPPTNGDY